MIESWTGFNVFTHLGQFLPFLKPTVPGRARSQGPPSRVRAGSTSDCARCRPGDARPARRLCRSDFTLALLDHGGGDTPRPGLVRNAIQNEHRHAFRRPCHSSFGCIHARRGGCGHSLIPVAMATHFFIPGTLGTFGAYFLPSGGIVQQQTASNVTVDPSDPRPVRHRSAPSSRRSDAAPRRAASVPRAGLWNKDHGRPGGERVPARRPVAGQPPRDGARRPRCLVVADPELRQSRAARCPTE